MIEDIQLIIFGIYTRIMGGTHRKVATFAIAVKTEAPRRTHHTIHELPTINNLAEVSEYQHLFL
jgi:hypothetical protein